MAETITTLNETLLAELRKEKFVMLTTVDAETGAPVLNAISWLYAMDEGTLRFAVDQRSRIVGNIKNNPQVTIAFFADNTVNAVIGTCSVAAETLEEVPLKLVCFEVNIGSVRNVMFYGARISVEPEYEKTYDKRAAEKLDTQVYTAMKKA